MTIAALSIGVCASQAFAAGLPDCMLGRWRSNEALTLADMREHPEVTPKARAFMEADFFGRLVLVNTRTLSGSIFEPAKRNSLTSKSESLSLKPDPFSLKPFEVLSSTPTSAVIRTVPFGVDFETEWFCEGNLIYALVTGWRFREYFTPE